MKTPVHSSSSSLTLTGAALRSRDAADVRARTLWSVYAVAEAATEAAAKAILSADPAPAGVIASLCSAAADWRAALAPLSTLAPRWRPEHLSPSHGRGLDLGPTIYCFSPENVALCAAQRLSKALVSMGVPVPDLDSGAVAQWLADVQALGVE